MSRQTSDNFKQTHTTHYVLIGTPLVLILIFCFSFVLLQPAEPEANQSAASQSAAEPTEAAGDSSQTLAPADPLTTASTPTMTEASPVEESSASTGSPQTTNTSNVNSANPQNSGGQQVNSHTTIKLPPSIMKQPTLH